MEKEMDWDKHNLMMVDYMMVVGKMTNLMVMVHFIAKKVLK
jgi:hypothetical protein